MGLENLPQDTISRRTADQPPSLGQMQLIVAIAVRPVFRGKPTEAARKARIEGTALRERVARLAGLWSRT